MWHPLLLSGISCWWRTVRMSNQQQQTAQSRPAVALDKAHAQLDYWHGLWLTDPGWIDDPRATATGTVTRTGTRKRSPSRTRAPSPFLASNLCKANLMRRTASSRFVCAADVARQKFHEYLISDSIVDRLGQHPFRAIGNMILRQFRDIIKLHLVCFVCLCLLAKFIVHNLARKKPHSGCMNK